MLKSTSKNDFRKTKNVRLSIWAYSLTFNTHDRFFYRKDIPTKLEVWTLIHGLSGGQVHIDRRMDAVNNHTHRTFEAKG